MRHGAWMVLALVLASGCEAPTALIVVDRGAVDRTPQPDSGVDLRVPMRTTWEGKVCAKKGWCWEGKLQTEQTLRAIWGTEAGRLFVVGDGGVILYHDGKRWGKVGSGATESLYGIWGSGPSDVYVVGDQGIIMHHDGCSWKKQYRRSELKLRGVWGTGPTDVWVVGNDGVVLHKVGKYWEEEDLRTTADLNAIWGTREQAFMVGDRGTIFSWTKDPARHAATPRWTLVNPAPTSNDLLAVWAVNSWYFFAAGEDGTVLYEGGHGWKNISPSPGAALRGIAGDRPNDLFVAGDSGEKLHHQGHTWLKMPSQATGAIHGLWRAPDWTLFAVGDRGSIFRWHELWDN